MNIAFCYITPFHPNKGGIGRVTDKLTRELMRRGHNVYYLIFKSGMTIEHEFDYPVPLQYLPSTDLMSEDNLKFYHTFLKEKEIDIVGDQGGNFAEYPLWLNTGSDKIKKISVIHTYDTVTYRNLWNCDIYPLRDITIKERIKRIARVLLTPKIKHDFRKRMKKSYDGMFAMTDAVVLLSKNFLKEIDELCPGYKNKIHFIGNPNSYDNSDIDLPAEKQKRIAFVGLFSTHKREDWAAIIWRKLYKDYPDWHFDLIGYGNEMRTRNLKKLAEGMPNFHILGYQNPLPYQLNASIYCMTSPNEGWGMVLTEAMQCGAVPIAFNSFAAASEIITPGVDGELVTAFDEKEYATKLRKLMDDEEYRNRLSRNARESVKRFDVANIADRWEALFNELKNA